MNHAVRMGPGPKCPMSAYSASEPVKCQHHGAQCDKGCKIDVPAETQCMEWIKRLNTAGIRKIINPIPAKTANHNTITGPNNLPIVAVPCDCIAYRQTKMIKVMGTTKGLSAGVATLILQSPTTLSSQELPRRHHRTKRHQ